jgi:hypothetical protein
MLFCKSCSNIVDISKSGVVKNFNIDDDPASLSDNDEDLIESIIEKLLKDNSVDLKNITTEQILNHDAYIKLDKTKKSTIKSKLEEIVSKQNDTTSSASYVCKTCSRIDEIPEGTIIASKLGTNTQTEYYNEERFKNKVYNQACKYTRAYICPNKSCIGNTDKTKHEAIIYRVGDTMTTMYTCMACRTVIHL